MIDLTDDADKMESETVTAAPNAVTIKTEPIEVAKVKNNKDPNAPTAANVAAARKERR
jgi:hypothetical protein